MSRKSRKDFYERHLANLRQPFVGYKGPPITDPRLDRRQRIYLRKAKLPVMSEEDRLHYDRVLRFLRATITLLDDKTSLPRDRVRSISHLLAAVELVRPDIQDQWRNEFVDLLAAYREMARRYVKQVTP